MASQAAASEKSKDKKAANSSKGRGIGIATAAESNERSHGQLHVYDGEGKGKSQAALGVVLRTIGLGICEQRRTRVLLLRFLKGPGRAYDEDAAIEALQQGFPHLIDQVRTGRGEFFIAEEATPFDRQEAQRGWDIAKGAIASALYSVVVLDELNPVLDLGLLAVEDVVHTLSNRPDGMEIIVTGRAAPRALVQVADLHSEMRAHRRPKPEDGSVIPFKSTGGIEIYTGEGKGKSTSALGKALQAIGRGISQDKSHRVLILQWLKGGSGYTEDAAIAALRESYPHLVDHLRSGRDAIVWRGQQQPIDYVEAERAWEIARAAIASGLYKTVILDELNPSVGRLVILSVA